MFETIDRLKPDQILGLMAQFRADPFPQKVDLGVGVYRDLERQHAGARVRAPRRADSCSRRNRPSPTWRPRAARNSTRRGRTGARAPRTRRVASAAYAPRRHPGGCGALRVGAELIRAAAPATTVHVSDPTWGNHTPLLGQLAASKLERYPYYDAADPPSCASTTCWSGWTARARGRRRAGARLLPQPVRAPICPWANGARSTELLARRRLTPFLDLAYQGFGTDLDDGRRRDSARRRERCPKR